MSLKTGDRRTAIRRALALDLALEEVMIMEAPPSGLTIRTLLVNLRNELVLEGEMERASRPTTASAALGALPVAQTASAADASLSELLAVSDLPYVPDEDLVEDHPLGRYSPSNAQANCVALASRGAPPPDLATPALRAAHFTGLSRYMARAAQRNDLDLADGVVERLLAKHAPGVPVDDAVKRLLRRSALRTLSEVHAINAHRERGEYTISPIADPTLDIPLGSAPACPPPKQSVQTPEVSASSVASVKLLSEVYADYERFMMSSLAEGGPWRNQTQRQNAMTMRLFTEFAGNRPLHTYNKDDAKAFKVALQHLPTLHGRSPEWRLSMSEAVERVKALMVAGQELPDCLSIKTIKRHMSALSGLFDWLSDRSNEYGYKGHNPFKGHTYGKSKATATRGMWDSSDLQALFATPIWTGCDPSRRAKAGASIIYDAYYWFPLIATYHGLRQEEIAQLRATDIQMEEGVWIMNIHDEGRNQLKNETAERQVPIHKILIGLGFLDYVNFFRTRADDHLWPALKRGGPDEKYAHYYTQRFTSYSRQTKVYDPARPFHAMRASFRTFLEETEAKSAHISKLIGHSLNGELGVGAIYTKRIKASVLKQVVDMFDPQLDLSHLIRFDPRKHKTSP
jgi:integrase